MTVADTYAEKWENEYGCEGLLQGLAKKSLNSILNYAKYLAEKRDYEKLNTLSRSDFFKKRYALHGAMKGDSPRQESGTSPAQERTLQIVLPRIGGIASS